MKLYIFKETSERFCSFTRFYYIRTQNKSGKMDNKFEISKLEKCSVMQILCEKLDTNIAPAIKSELVLLSGNGEKNIIIDLSNTRYCDSSGLSAILVANRLCKNSKGTFVLSGLQSAVERLISISQLDTVLNITDNTEQAIEFINSKQIEN
jgi:anti-anti-sigma factor